MNWQCCWGALPHRQQKCCRYCCHGHKGCKAPMCPHIRQGLSCHCPGHGHQARRERTHSLHQLQLQTAVLGQLRCPTPRACFRQLASSHPHQPLPLASGLLMARASKQLHESVSMACDRACAKKGDQAGRRLFASCLTLSLFSCRYGSHTAAS